MLGCIQRLFLSLALATGAASPALSQSSAQGQVSFNLFSFEGAYLNRIFRFDADYTAKYGVPVPAPFVVEVPVRQDVELIADGKPSGGLVKFTFATKDTGTRQFIENFHVVDARFPRLGDSDEARQSRSQQAAQALIKSAFPAAVQGFQDPKILKSGVLQINGITAVEVIGTYMDPANGPMVLQLVALPHPARDESYFTIRNIARALVPMSGPEQLPETLGGRVLSSFSYE